MRTTPMKTSIDSLQLPFLLSDIPLLETDELSDFDDITSYARHCTGEDDEEAIFDLAAE